MDLDVNIRNIAFFSNKKITNYKVLSKSFGMICEKIETKSSGSFVIKRNLDKNKMYDSLKYETKSLIYMKNLFPNIFPKIYYHKKDLLVMNYIEHDNIKDKNFEKELAENISAIHSVNNDRYGFNFDTPIGGLKQPSEYSDNWVDFYRENRLGMIFNQICFSNPMPNSVNKKIDKILTNLENFIPKNPIPSLIHGDLWEGNIFYNKGRLVGLIDPGIYFAHKELEISYLTWFKLVTKKFLVHYSEKHEIDKNYPEYEPIYQLYFSLLNVHLWSRDYINDAKSLVDKIYK
tara:strand:- start:321 stop:1187 length:867 start_codon:yes stop_codon:yes gene_type:complete